MKNTKFEIETTLGTFFLVLAFLGWISFIIAIREAPEFEILSLLCSLILSGVAIKFIRLTITDKASFQKPCEKCGEIITYYWFFGFYVGRHIWCKENHYRKGLTDHS